MKNGKIMAIAAALMMMAVCITVVDATDDADATKWLGYPSHLTYEVTVFC